ncbi:hypothetical protein AN619_26180 [Thermotalea metallivorans]|uniref:PepSY domain-containing protein n=2 Tax=Thermotalea metallivorans TaxID=520762 RepID=A0A140L0M8_9FIRM|nr:hypothetical protein AN619_26180 [Thermotalea metallivorans]
MSFILVLMVSGCAGEQVDLNQAVKPSDTGKIHMITREEAIKIVENHPETKTLGKEKLVLEEEIKPTEDRPFWEFHLNEEQGLLTYVYVINAYTGELLSLYVENEEHKDEEVLKEEMLRHVQWTFENWQSFHYENYDPSRYGLAFALNFRLTYLFENYEENKKFVEENKVISRVKIQEIKDVGMAYSEEDETMYAQMRVIADYRQEIGGQTIREPVEVLIFSKRHLDGDEGWQITNVDMYPVWKGSKGFHQLFFGFRKTS